MAPETRLALLPENPLQLHTPRPPAQISRLSLVAMLRYGGHETAW
jgi:hypothetical protein